MAKRSLESNEEGLIPGLLDDLALQCLARISHGYEGMAQCVCRRWRDAFRSEEIGQIRAREGLSGDWLFVITSKRTDVGWEAYDPSADRWHPLPPAPAFSPCWRHIGFCCVVFNCRLWVLGGLSLVEGGASNRVFCFDPFFRKWDELPGMKVARGNFACAVIDGRILVAGGSTASAEHFVPERKTWEALPKMPKRLYQCGAMSINGQFQVLGHTSYRSPRHFILNGNRWKTASQTQELPSLRAMKMTQMDGRLYGIFEEGLAVLNENTREWRIVSEPPYFWVPGLKRDKLSCPGFIGLNGRLYLVGGSQIVSKDDGLEVVDFSTVQYCDPSARNPARWHDARPLLSGSGLVLACAALQQE